MEYEFSYYNTNSSSDNKDEYNSYDIKMVRSKSMFLYYITGKYIVKFA